jgi:hypothetical protein
MAEYHFHFCLFSDGLTAATSKGDADENGKISKTNTTAERRILSL